MTKLRKLTVSFFLILSFVLWFQMSVIADEDLENDNQDTIERLQVTNETLWNYSVTFRRNIPLWSPVIIDLWQLKEIASEWFPDIELRFEWSVWEEQIQWEVLNYTFEDFWNKEIQLEVFWIIDETELIVYESEFEVFVFSQTMMFLIEENYTWLYTDFQERAKRNGILVNEFWFFQESQLWELDFWELYRDYTSRFSESSDFVVVLWSKEFAITFLRQGNITWKINNIVILSSYNRTLFREYFRNSFPNEDIQWNAFLLNDIYIDQLLRNPQSYLDLRSTLIQNWYSILDFDFEMRWNPLFFISSQIQFLWRHFTQSELYILLLIPFFLTAISLFKHIIWINTLWIIIPVFLTYLMIYVGIIESLIFFITLWCINIILAQYLNRYALLYTPKITLLMLVNICIFFLIWHIFEILWLMYINFQSLIMFIFFIVLSERFLVIATSKEFLEYKSAIIWTLVLSSLLALVSHIDLVRIVLFSYPEMILLLIPLNLYVAQFTGLRIAEYLRFKELMKDIEE